MKVPKPNPVDRKSLLDRLNSVLVSNLTDFLKSTQTWRDELLSNRTYAFLVTFFSISVMFFVYLTWDLYGTTIFKVTVVYVLVWMVVIIFSAKQWLVQNRVLAREMNMSLVPILTNTLDRMVLYTHDAEHREETKQTLFESKLISSPDVQLEADDTYVVFASDGAVVAVRELVLFSPDYEQAKKDNLTNQLFKGVFVVATLSHNHLAETYISTEGDKVGFSHQSFWSAIIKTGEIKEILPEHNDFKTGLHVASSDPAVAKELLNPDFMSSLHTWWLEHQLNVRVAFRGNKIYMLIPNQSIKLNHSTPSTHPRVIRSYAWSVVVPIWRALRFVEDVSGAKS
jgi:hypothetical protein